MYYMFRPTCVIHVYIQHMYYIYSFMDEWTYIMAAIPIKADMTWLETIQNITCGIKKDNPYRLLGTPP